ncbi:hypothetical protein LRR18_16095 [Mangrovimonas sp. AS39]|nr:hypothetical protein [Mangrovimonas futianensis]MCF1193111.1 hypothetical protein [Mangrovimonas futianensis]
MYATNFDRIQLQIPQSSVLHSDLIRYSYIQLCIILDEIDTLNRLAKDDEYLKDTLYIVTPAIRAIKKYTGIRKARNFMLAHYNRDKKGNFYPWWRALKDLKLPRLKQELTQIYTYLHAINGIIVTRYYEELKDISQTAGKEVDEYYSWVRTQEELAIKDDSPFDNIESEIENRMAEFDMKGIIQDPFVVNVNDYVKKNYG